MRTIVYIVSNDSDMAEAMGLVRKHHPRKILVLVNPGVYRRTSEQLKKHAHFVIKIRNSLLQESQLPNNIPGTNITKPDDWRV